MGEQQIDKKAKQRIYAIGARLGIVGHGHEDDLHALVAALTGKEGVSALTAEEGKLVEQELTRRAASLEPRARARKRERKYEELPGGMTAKQQKYAWYLMSEIERFDPAPDGVALRYRMCGLVEKKFGVTAFPQQPFRFLTWQQGSALIEALKSMATRKELEYLHSAAGRRERQVAGP